MGRSYSAKIAEVGPERPGHRTGPMRRLPDALQAIVVTAEELDVVGVVGAAP